MGAPFHSVDRKCEDAIATIIEALRGANLVGYTIYKGFSGAELVPNRIHVFCDSAQPEIAGESDVFTGNWRCHVIIEVASNYQDKTRDERELANAELFDILLDQSNLAELINNQGGVADFTAYGGEQGEGECFTPDMIENEPTGHEYIKRLTGTLYCRPS